MTIPDENTFEGVLSPVDGLVLDEADDGGLPSLYATETAPQAQTQDALVLVAHDSTSASEVTRLLMRRLQRDHARLETSREDEQSTIREGSCFARRGVTATRTEHAVYVHKNSPTCVSSSRSFRSTCKY